MLQRANCLVCTGRPSPAPSDAVLPLLQDKDLEVCAVNLKVDQLEAELQDLNSQESKDEASLAKVFKNVALHLPTWCHCRFCMNLFIYSPVVCP